LLLLARDDQAAHDHERTQRARQYV